MGFCKSGKLLWWQLLNLLLWLLEQKFCTSMFAIGQKRILPDDAAEVEHGSSPSLDDLAFFSQSPLLWLPCCTNGLCPPFKWTRGLRVFHSPVGLNIASVSSMLVDKAWLTVGISIYPKGVWWVSCRHVFHNRLCKPISGHSLGGTAMLEWEGGLPQLLPKSWMHNIVFIIWDFPKMEVIGCAQNLANQTWPKVYRQEIKHFWPHSFRLGDISRKEYHNWSWYQRKLWRCWSKTSRWLIKTQESYGGGEEVLLWSIGGLKDRVTCNDIAMIKEKNENIRIIGQLWWH